MTSSQSALLPRSAAPGSPISAGQPTQQRPEPGQPLAVTHAHYRREPYVRCRIGTAIIDGKAAAWTRTQVLLHWIDDAGRAHNRWIPAETVHRIPRDESAWQDPYDDWSFYYPVTQTPAELRHYPVRGVDAVPAAA